MGSPIPSRDLDDMECTYEHSICEFQRFGKIPQQVHDKGRAITCFQY